MLPRTKSKVEVETQANPHLIPQQLLGATTGNVYLFRKLVISVE